MSNARRYAVKAKMRRFCVVCLSAGMVVVLIAMTYTLPDKTLLDAALVGFWAALATLAGVIITGVMGVRL